MPEGDPSQPVHPAPTSDDHRPVGPFSPFLYPGYRLLWTLGLLSGSASQMQMVVNSWLLYDLTRSPAALGLLGVFRAVPLVALSLFGGAMADAVNRRKLLVMTQGIRTLVGLVLLALAATRLLDVWHIYALTLVNAAAQVFDGPTRQAILPTTVPRSAVTNAIVLNSTTNQLTRTVGPSVAGLFLAIAAGPVLAYAVNALLFCAGWATVGMLHVPAIVRQGARPSMLRLMGEGLGFMRATPVVLFLLLLDFFATFFTAYDALLPVFAREVLGVGAEGFGVLASAPSIGAFVGSATILVFFGRVERRGRAVLVAVFLYGLAILAFSVSSAFALSLVALMAAGMLDQTAVAMRNSTLLLLTPNELRGRVESIRIMFIQGGPTLGGVQAGALAGAIGPGLTLALESGMVLVTVLVIHLRVRDLWRLRIR